MAQRHFLRLGLCISTSSILLASMAIAAGPYGFEIGGSQAPPVMPAGYSGAQPPFSSLPADFNTTAHWQRLKDAGIDLAFCSAYFVPNQPLYKAENESAIASSTAVGAGVLLTDHSIYGRPVTDIGQYEYWNSVLPNYASDARVKGFYLRDEPTYAEVEGLANSYRRIKEFNPDWRVHVNLALSPWAPDHQANTDNPIAVSSVYSTGWGTYVMPSNSLGQTITIPNGIKKITEIEFYLDKAQWTAGEVLTATVWDSPAKQQSYGQASLTGTTTFFPHFVFPGGAAVPANHNVYVELTHNGGGDGSVGWVLHSQYDTYKGGTGYQGGNPQNLDFYFRVYGQRVNAGDVFENLIDDWVNLSGADHIQSTSFYPLFPSGTLYADYFTGLERLRGRGLAHGLPYGVYLQSVALNGGPDPSNGLMRWNAFTAAAYGVRQLNWFTYWTPIVDGGDWPAGIVSEDGTPGAKYDAIKALNTELHAYGTVLKDTISRRVFHTGPTLPNGVRPLPGAFFVRPTEPIWPLLFGYLTTATNQRYLMVVNRDPNNPQSNVTLRFDNPPSTVQEISKVNGTKAAAPGYSNGILPIASLGAGDARFYYLSAGHSNLVATAAVTASSSWETTGVGCGLSKANDDIRYSTDKKLGWSSESSLSTNHSEWLKFSLGVGSQVSSVDLYPLLDGQFFPATYSVETSEDDVNWSVACTRSTVGAVSTVQSCNFATRSANYVRITGSQLKLVNGEYRMQLGEVEVYGKRNFAFNATVTASSSEEAPPAWGLAPVHDRQRAMVTPPHGSGWGWSSSSNLGQNHTESLTFALAERSRIYSVVLCPRNSSGYAGEGFPIDFNIKTRTTGGAWSTRVIKTAVPKPDHRCQTYNFTAVEANDVMIEGTNLRPVAGQYRMQFSEVEIN